MLFTDFSIGLSCGFGSSQKSFSLYGGLTNEKIAVFGSTGSIGTQTLSVAGFHPDEFEVYAIAANKNAEQVVRSANEFHPKFIGMYDEAAAREVSERCPGITVVSGGEVNSLAALSEVDIVVNGVSGFAGLFPLLSALRAGKTVALANKESIVCGHVVVNRTLAEFGGKILPVDSEQSAIFNALPQAAVRMFVRLF